MEGLKAARFWSLLVGAWLGFLWTGCAIVGALSDVYGTSFGWPWWSLPTLFTAACAGAALAAVTARFVVDLLYGIIWGMHL